MASKLLCSIANIGANPVINVQIDCAGAQSWKLTWSFKELSGVIKTGTSITNGKYSEQITDFTWDTALYALTPRAPQADVTLLLRVYSDRNFTNIIESVPFIAYAKVNVSSSTPQMYVPLVTDVNENTIALTGDNDVLIRYASTARLAYRVLARNSAYLFYVYAMCGTEKVEAQFDELATFIYPESFFENVQSQAFKITARDSREFISSITYTLPAERFVEYFPPTCRDESERPDTGGDMQARCAGNWFNGSFGAQSNTLAVEYCYMEQGGTWSDWTTMDVSVNGNTYTATANLTGLDYQKTYVFEFRATDKIKSVSSAEAVTSALPVFHWSADDFVHETPVDFRAGFKVNGNESDMIEEQGTDGAWAYRKWTSGFAECWGRFTKSVSGNDWTAFGSLYEAEIVANEAYPFAFTDAPHEIATLHSMAGGMIDSTAIGMSASTTGAYYVVHPNKLTSTYGVSLDLYVIGRWKD
jgi:hypothetical protein